MLNDLTDKTFGKLRVIGMAERTQKKTFWVCECECGNKKEIRSDSLTSKRTSSCGCVKKMQDAINLKTSDRIKNATYTSKTRLYRIWQLMHDRCLNPNNTRWDNYGGRGIAICGEWQRPNFENFKNWALVNGYNEKLSIDRIENDGNYESDNCRWSNNKDQCNNRGNNVKITMNGQTRNMKQWCEELKLDYGLVSSRHQRGMSLDKMFSRQHARKTH